LLSGVSCDQTGEDVGTPSDPPRCRDLDRDGLAAQDCGGNDCDDSDPERGGPDTNGVVGDWAPEIAVRWNGSTDDSRDALDLKLDESNAVHIIVAGTYATNRTGAFVMESVTGSKSHWSGTPGLAVAAGVVHVTFVNDSGVSYASRQNGSWTQQLIDGVGVVASAIALDGMARPCIAYVSSGGLSLAHPMGDGWAVAQLVAAQAGQSMPAVSLAFDAGGQPQIVAATCREGDCKVEHGPVLDDEWAAELVGAAKYVGNVAFALDEQDRPHVAFTSAAIEAPSLYYAHRRAGRWTVSPVAGGGWVSVDLAVSGSSVRLVSQAGGVAYLMLEDGALVSDPHSNFPTTGAGCDCWGGTAIAAGRDGSNHVAFSGFNFALGTHVYYSTDQTIAPDGIDQNCDGVDGIDADADGFASIPTAGLDCNDADVTVFPGNNCP
jgi:hypothetical protein